MSSKSRSDREKQIRQNKLRYVLDYLSTHPCIACGEADPVVLDFDHRDPNEKTEMVSNLIQWGYSQKRLEAEIAKCDVLCANCHRRRTAKQFGWYANAR